jgi:peptidoglycan/LPS O-acetylase OafA/YrhL
LSTRQVAYLDLVRVFAAEVVLVHHTINLIGHPEAAHGVQLGGLGVTIFFLLSGFLIGRSAERHAGPDYGLREFLIDRCCRVYVCFVPALIFTAVLVAPLATQPTFAGQPHVGVLQFLGNLLMLQDYPLFQILRRSGLDADWFVRPYALAEPYWTVPIELFLYIGFGVIYFCCIRGARLRSHGLQLLAAVAVLPVLYHASTGFGQCLTLTWLLGVLAARGIDLPQRLSRRAANATATAARRPASELRFIVLWCAAAVGMLGLRFASREASFYDLQGALFLGMLLLGGLWLAPRQRWLSVGVIRTPVKFLAKASYPLYLTHNVVIGWTVMHFGKDLTLPALLALGATCHALAFVFWWAFDRHYKTVATWLRTVAPQAQPVLEPVNPLSTTGPHPT